MNTTELCREIHDRYPEYNIYEIEDFMMMFVTTLTDVLKSEDSVTIKHLGQFIPRRTKTVLSGAFAHIQGEGHLTVKYKPSTVMLSNLRKK